MNRISFNNVQLDLDVQGAGEAVLLIHGGVIADAFAPLMAEAELAGRHRLIHYHRRGFAGSTHPDAPVSIEEQAADARAVLRSAGVDRAHVVGYSYGGVIALQLALDAPEAVQSLALLEPALMMVPSAPRFFEVMTPIVAAYQAGDSAGAITGFMAAVGGGVDHSPILDAVLPAGWFDLAVADAATLFEVELPALPAWAFNQDLARRIGQPVLAVVGADSGPLFDEGHQLMRTWLPRAEPFVIPGATHALPMTNAREVATALAGFFAQHALPVAA